MHYALRDDRYPIETVDQIKLASEYFTHNLDRFSPSDRVEVATKMEKRAEELNYDMDIPWVTNYSRMMKKEASYSPEFEKNMNARKDICNVYHVEVNVGGNMVKAAELIDKMIGEKNQTEPMQMVVALSEFDKLAKLEAHYDTRVTDPVFTVYGSNYDPDFDMEKIACSGKAIAAKAIRKASKDKKFIEKMSSMMGTEFAADFQKSPVTIFESMPSPEQQLMIENM
jgi:hypothetical protein